MPPLTRRVPIAIAAAVIAALVLSTHAFSRARLVRVKLVDAARTAANGEVRVTMANSPDALSLAPPFALIAFVDVPSGASVSVSVDGQSVCERQLASGSSKRIDCAVTGNWNQSVSHDISVRGPSTAWTLRSLELATYHGHTSGAHYLIFLPAGTRSFARPTLAYIALVSIALGFVLAMPQREALPRVVRRIYIGVAIAIAATLVVIECSDLVSPYLVVMSAGTFARWMCWVCLPWLWMAGRWLLRPPAAPHDRAAGWSRPIVVAGVVVIAFYAVATARVNDYFGGNYSGLLVVSRSAFVNNPLVAERSDVRNSVVLQDVGYDGQFMYFAMFDPFLRRFSDNPATYRRVMDAPPYRYGRIGFPLLTLIASGGQWPRFPIVMMWLILCGIGLFAVLLARMAQDAGVTPAVGGLALLIPGFWQSIQLSLPEPIAAATLLAGILCASQRRWWPAAALFAVSMLTRETGIIAIACVLTADAMRGRWRPALLVGASAAGVVLLWRAYVAWTLFPDWGIQGLLFHPPDLGLPFAGIADLWRAVLRGDYHPGVPDMHRAAIAYPLVLMSGFALAVVLAIRLPHAWHVAAVVYGLIAISLNLPAIWVHVSNAQRGTFELFVMLALSALTMRQYSRRLGIAVAAFWAISFLYVFFLGYDAGYIRSVLPLI